MKNKFYLGIFFLLTSHIIQAGNFVVIGDSLSDTGNLARFTYNSGKIYNENLAAYLNEEFPVPNGGSSTLFGGVLGIKPPSLKGPNYAQGGATANTNLGMGRNFFSGSFIKFQTDKQVNTFLKTVNKNKQEDLKNLKLVYWIGGNDMRLASEVIDSSAKEIINKSIEDIGKQVKQLADNGIPFMIIPNVPDIAYTPKFFKQFAETTKIDGKLLYKEKKWYSSKGVTEDFFENLLDEVKLEPEKSFDDIIKNAIKKLLEKQNENSSEENINKWFNKYKEEREKLSNLGKYFNYGVDQELKKIVESNKNFHILRPDISSMISEVVKYPEYYGFTNVTGTASKTFSSAVANIFRWGAGSGKDRIAAFEPEDGIEGKGGLDKKHLWGKGYRYVFGDEFHPSPEAHKIISDYIISLLESEDGQTYDSNIVYSGVTSKDQTFLKNIKGSSITEEYETSQTYERGYVPYGAIRVREGAKLKWKGLKLKNDGISLSSEGENSLIELENFYIQNKARVNAVIQAENGGNVVLKNGEINSERGSRLTYPFGIRINGKNSKVTLLESKFSMNGNQAVAISVGNSGKLEINSSQVLANGKKGKALHLWNADAELKKSILKAENGTGIWIFANDAIKNKVNLSIEDSEISAKEHAIKISPNITKIPVVGDIKTKNSKIYGAIFTDKESNSNIDMERTFWNMGENSSISNLILKDSEINFSPEEQENFHTLIIDGNYQAKNALLHMKGKLEKDDSPTDLFVVKGDVQGNTLIDYKNIGGKGALTNYGIKIVDLSKKTEKNAFQLIKPVYAGKYEYTLLAGGNNAKEKEDFYLTSTLIYKNGKIYIPTLRENIILSSFGNSLYSKQSFPLRLLRPEISIKSLIPYANMESNFQNIFHLKNRKNVFFTLENSNKTLEEKDKSKIKIKNSISKLSYPLNDNFGIFFSVGQNNIELHDMVRKYFNKDTKLDTVKRKDVNFGIYYQHSFHTLNLDHTLQYQWFQNQYKVNDISYKNNGMGIAYSSFISSPFYIRENWIFEPHYQIDIFHERFVNNSRYAIRNYLGSDILWKNRNFNLILGMNYQWDLRKIPDIKIDNEYYSHKYKTSGLLYKLGAEYNINENLKLHVKTEWKAKREKTAYEIGIKYKF